MIMVVVVVGVLHFMEMKMMTKKWNVHFSSFLDRHFHIAKKERIYDGGGVAFSVDEDDDEEGGMAWSSK